MSYQYAKKNVGKSGIICKVKTNFAPIKITNKIIYNYVIQINFPINNQGDCNVNQRSKIRQQKINEKIVNRTNYEIFQHLVQTNKDLFTSEPVFDCKNNIYSSTLIEFGERKRLEVKFKIPERKFAQNFDIILIRPKHYIINLNENGVNFAERELQALNTIINYGNKRFNLILNSNSFPKYDDLNQMDKKKINFDLGNLKQARLGYYNAVKSCENGPKLCVDKVVNVFNKGSSLIDLIEEFCTSRNRKNKYNNKRVKINHNFSLKPDEIRKLNEELNGLDFVVNHSETKFRNTIYQLTQQSVSQITFDYKGRTISIKKYFEELYADYCSEILTQTNNNGELFGKLPCVQVGKINPKYFPLEVVKICQDQYCRKKLNPIQQAKMIKFANQNPIDRFISNQNQLKNIKQCSRRSETDYLKQFGIDIDEFFEIINGRVLEAPYLLGGKINNEEDKRFQPCDAKWKTNNSGGFNIPFDSTNFKWAVINITNVNGRSYTSPLEGEINDLINTILDSADENKIKFPNPFKIKYDESVITDGNDDIIDLIEEIGDVKLILFLIPKITDGLYDRIKFICDCELGIITQCVSHINSKQFNDMSYATNVLLKINAKLGGVTSILDPKFKIGFLKGKTMIMGIDVTHPDKTDRIQNSIASIVSSYDSKKVKYHSVSFIQEGGYKEIVKLDEVVKDLLTKFYNQERKEDPFYPDRIVVYRDGVGEGHFKEVMEKEIRSMKIAFNKLGCNPKLTYIICQKRHNTRFLPENPKDRLKSGNIKPGLVVDTGIVSSLNEFYLYSHFGALGTSRPTHYIVLYDESNFNGDEIQKATYYLSYLYPKCLQTVAVVPPVLYAHLSAKRARSYVSILNSAYSKNRNNETLSPEQIKKYNEKIKVKGQLDNKLYFI